MPVPDVEEFVELTTPVLVVEFVDPVLVVEFVVPVLVVVVVTVVLLVGDVLDVAVVVGDVAVGDSLVPVVVEVGLQPHTNIENAAIAAAYLIIIIKFLLLKIEASVNPGLPAVEEHLAQQICKSLIYSASLVRVRVLGGLRRDTLCILLV